MGNLADVAKTHAERYWSGKLDDKPAIATAADSKHLALRWTARATTRPSPGHRPKPDVYDCGPVRLWKTGGRWQLLVRGILQATGGGWASLALAKNYVAENALIAFENVHEPNPRRQEQPGEVF